MLRQIRPAFVLLVLFSALTGLVYPLAITGVAQAVLPYPANGSLAVNKDGAPIGSVLIGQNFASDRYFHEDITAPFVLEAGRLRVPTGAGLGVEVRRDVIDRMTTRRSVVRPG